jgi:hypothetical protein
MMIVKQGIHLLHTRPGCVAPRLTGHDPGATFQHTLHAIARWSICACQLLA